MRPIMLALLFLSFSGIAIAEDETFSFKGYKLGASYSEIKAMPGLYCDPVNTPVADEICIGKDTIANADAFVNLFITNKTLHTILLSFDEEFFNKVALALGEKYGKPQKTDIEVVQNQMGASFENRKAYWYKGGSTLMLVQRGSKLSQSSLMFRLDSAVKESAKRREGETKSNAKDL
jgi:hypothetical protein